MSFSVRKVMTAEQATFLGVNVGDTVFVAPMNDIVPLVQAYEAPTPVPAGNLAFATKSDGSLTANEKKILSVLKSLGNTGYGRAEVLDKAKMTPSEWSTAIASLKSANLVKQTGDRRSAKYYVVGEPSAEAPEPTATPASPELQAALDLAKRALAGEDISKEPIPTPAAPTPEPEASEPITAAELDETIDEIPDEPEPETDSADDAVAAALKELAPNTTEW